MKLLVVEDDADLAAALASALRAQKMIVDVAASLRQASELVFAASYDVLVVDRGLPDGDGLTLVAQVRGAQMFMPVLVLTAKIEIAERVRSLDGGADDYLAKPFAIDELLARIRALARRPSVLARDVANVGNLTFDYETREVRIGDDYLALPRRELLVLETLLLSTGRTVARSRLVDRVYADAEDIQSNSLDAHVSRLRVKLEQMQAQVEIHAVRGVGYLLRERARRT
ncbi:response regulator transcription factor [Comamonas terrigena]|uniref:response regulator transcription factor n=1 Tax=Comamonas terrigena TaxID=32013 RepID=UPI002448AE47|nr:response regulator transcription factor [Comamonas terrigena]MDH1701915.1 response regulator transcription factor [Comamonas terrigena]